MRTQAGAANTDVNVSCPSSNPIAVGGGLAITETGGTIRVSAPIISSGALATNDQTPTGWRGRSDKAITVYVVCAK